MSNNSSLASSGISLYGGGCDIRWYSKVGTQLELPIYYILYPICLFLGFIGRLACFIAFYKQSKKEPAYFHQVSLTVGELIEILTSTGYNMVMICGWNLNTNAPWCLSNYPYMWYEAHLAVPLINMTAMVKNFQAIFMAADRVVALWKPTIYRNLPQKSLRAGSVIVSVIIGVSMSIFDCFRYLDPQLRRGTSSYLVSVNMAFLKTTTAIALSRFRDVLRGGQLIVLIGLNVAMVHLYFKQRRRIDTLLGQTFEERKQRKKVKGDISLLLLTLSQCFFGAIGNLSAVIYYSFLAAKPSFDQCEASLWGPVSDGVYHVSEVAGFVFIIVFSQYFRQIIIGAFRC